MRYMIKTMCGIALIITGIFTESFAAAGLIGCAVYAVLIGLSVLGIVFPRGKHEKKGWDE